MQVKCYITNGTGASSIALAIANGANWVQIREKDLPARELLSLVREGCGARASRAASRLVSTPAKILVNTRVDVAIAAGADGVHLPAGSIAPNVWRKITPPRFLIGVSCHTLDEVQRAEAEGADYVVFGPVFAPLSKTSDLAPRGLEGLAHAAAAVKIPVLALGGITWGNAEACVEAGAAGVAGITLFQSC
jgi:thiamine-phosphate pyrophosphorylase